MTDVQGISINEFPFQLAGEVGTLMSNHYPSTIVYCDNLLEPIIKEWVDASEDNSIDRFFYYSVDKLILKKFITGEISHIDLINSSTKDYVIFQDEGEGIVLNRILLPSKEIPLNYKPSSDFFFRKSDGVDTEEIISFFKLNEIEINKEHFKLVKEISSKNKSETIYIHLEKGKGIGVGTINTAVFGETLLNFDHLYKNIALDQMLGVERGAIDLEAKKYQEYQAFAETQLYGERIRASYGFLIRPINIQWDLFGDSTRSEKIAETTFNLISKSLITETLKDEYLLHSGFTISSYKQFLDGVLRFQMRMDLRWFNPINNKEFYQDIDYLKANKIIFDIDNLSVTDQNDFSEKGKFRAVNCDTGHYHFTSLGEQQYSGYFDKPLRDGIVQINFIDIYEVKISRKIIKEAGKKEPKIVDTLIAYYQEK
jgi:hypothetical protein